MFTKKMRARIFSLWGKYCAGIALAAVLADLTGARALGATNLITNGNFAGGNSGFVTDYKFSPGNLVPAGRYDIVSTAADLTDDNPNFVFPTGRAPFMAVNGATVANQVVWQQSVTLTADTTYGFAAWVSSLFAASPAVLQFFVNGVQLGANYTAPATTNTWAQFTSTYFSGAGGTAAIVIRDTNTAAFGNDFGLTDLSLVATGAATPEPGVWSLTLIGFIAVGLVGARAAARSKGAAAS